jgi:hypothetical protein
MPKLIPTDSKGFDMYYDDMVKYISYGPDKEERSYHDMMIWLGKTHEDYPITFKDLMRMANSVLEFYSKNHESGYVSLTKQGIMADYAEYIMF